MKFKITLPPADVDPKDVESRNRAMFSDDLEGGGILAKSFIFCYLNQPSTITEITRKLNQYYETNLERTKIFRALQKLNEKFIVAQVSTTELLSIPSSERKKMHEAILSKHNNFLMGLPDAFRKKIAKVNYFWIPNGNGTKYIEWCCKLLNFKCQKEK